MDSTTLHIGFEPQLFVDNWLIEVTQGLTRRWHKPVRFGDYPVIERDRAWEETIYFTYSNYTVIRDPEDGLTKCWYEDLGPVDGQGHPWKARTLYAESEDGVSFRKPELDICTMDGRGTNIVMGYAGGTGPTDLNPWADVGVHSAGMVLDPFPTSPDERFKCFFTKTTSEFGKGAPNQTTERTYSPDGIHWKPYRGKAVLGTSGDRLGDVTTLHYDHDSHQFVLNTRHNVQNVAALLPGTPRVSHWFGPYAPYRPDLMNKRRVYQSRSQDFLHWTNPIVVSAPDDETDNLDDAHYGMQQFRVGGMHFATLGILRWVENEMDVRLVYSRDGVNFKPTDRAQPFLSPRGEGNWDAHMVSITSQPVEVGNEWWFYHGGTSSHHDWWMGPPEGIDEPEVHDPDRHVRFALGMAKLRREGIASLDGSKQREGYVITRPVMSDGDRLMINARCRDGGSIRVEVVDLNDRVMGGSSLDGCDPFTEDSTAHVVTWSGDPEVRGPGEWRKLAFYLRDAEIFSFRFAEGGSG